MTQEASADPLIPGPRRSPTQAPDLLKRSEWIRLLPEGVRKQYEATKDVSFAPDDRAVMVSNTESILHVQKQEGDQVWYSIGQTEALHGPVHRHDLVMIKLPANQA